MAVKRNGSAPQSGGGVGLALAGGGPLGGIYEVGALMALDEALDGVDLHNLQAYVGVSAGAFVAACLANRFSIAQLARIFISNESVHHPISPSVFVTPAYREFARRLASLPELLMNAAGSFVRNPLDTGLMGPVWALGAALPAGVFDNEPVHRFLADLYQTRGHTNDFRELKQKLFVVAADLDTGESVRFGSPPYDDVPISKAVQASTALPGLYPPVKIGDRYFVDGALQRTLHASAALETGVELLFCINPLVPYDANLAPPGPGKLHSELVHGGLPTVMSQTFRAVIHSRMKVGMNAYDTAYEDRDVVLFEPNRQDSRMFFANVFSYSRRRRVCEHAYQTTRRDLLVRAKHLKPVLARHGIKLRMDVLEDPHRNFESGLHVPTDVRRRGRYKNRMTNRLSETLDSIEEMLG
ncbi:MAG: patatin-like phospholipase family protein [Pseudomonadota bacterium]